MICLDELGPVSPRAYPPAPGWSLDGHRIKAPLEYSRGPQKVWVYGALRVEDGQALTLTAPSRNTKGYLRLLEVVEEANPTGEIYLITDNLATHKSPPLREWLSDPSASGAGVHPEGGSLAEPAGGMVADVPPRGLGRAALCRRRGDRTGYEDSHQTAQSSGETVGVGPTSQTAQTSEAHFCVPYLRNEALGPRLAPPPGPNPTGSTYPLPTGSWLMQD